MPRPKLRIVPLQNTHDLLNGRISLGPDFSIENIAGLLNEDTFQPFNQMLSPEDLKNLLSWDLCLVHEFKSDLTLGEEENTSELLMRFLVASCRWISPTDNGHLVCPRICRQGS